MRILLERRTAYRSYRVRVDPQPARQPHEAIQAIERDILDLAIEPGRALALRLFGPSKQNPAPGDEPAEDS